MKTNYIILDLEATCWDININNKPLETIEIGAIKYDSEYSKVSEFNCFVKPIMEPLLSQFCKNLTSINQHDIDNAKKFSEAVFEFQKWIDTSEEYLLCSWGFYDKKQLLFDCNLHEINTNWLFNHISLKHQYAKLKNLIRPIEMEAALKLENIFLDGVHHRGIDDARNIAKIFLKFKEAWQLDTDPYSL